MRKQIFHTQLCACVGVNVPKIFRVTERDGFSMKTGLKVWLWFLFIVNIISAFVVATAALFAPLLWVNVITEIILVVGVCLLLFGKKKVGFYLMCACAVISFVVNLISGTNIASAIVGLILCPSITYLLLKDGWEKFQ